MEPIASRILPGRIHGQIDRHLAVGFSPASHMRPLGQGRKDMSNEDKVKMIEALDALGYDVVQIVDQGTGMPSPGGVIQVAGQSSITIKKRVAAA